MYILLIGIIILLIITSVPKRNYPRNTKTDYNQQNTQIYEHPEEPINIGEYTGRYQKRLLLTKNEWYEYRKLKQMAESKGLQVCPKIRLLDLIEPRRGDPKYRTLFYKIQAKHVDFVICDASLYVKAIVELDDNSHNQTGRKERDDFVDTILKDVGYTVIRTRSITENTLSVLDTQNQPKTAQAGPDPGNRFS